MADATLRNATANTRLAHTVVSRRNVLRLAIVVIVAVAAATVGLETSAEAQGPAPIGQLVPVDIDTIPRNQPLNIWRINMPTATPGGSLTSAQSSGADGASPAGNDYFIEKLSLKLITDQRGKLSSADIGYVKKVWDKRPADLMDYICTKRNGGPADQRLLGFVCELKKAPPIKKGAPPENNGLQLTIFMPEIKANGVTFKGCEVKVLVYLFKDEKGRYFFNNENKLDRNKETIHDWEQYSKKPRTPNVDK